MLGGLTQIVDGSGKVTWKYPAATRDGEVLPNGNLLLTLSKDKACPGGAVVEVTRDLKVVWEYKGTQTEVNTAVLLPSGDVMLTEAGDRPRLLVVSRDGSIKTEIPLGCQTKNHHLQSRMARPLPNGHHLVPQEKTVREYDAQGKVVWERQSPSSPLDNRAFCCLPQRRRPHAHQPDGRQPPHRSGRRGQNRLGTPRRRPDGRPDQPGHRPRLASERQHSSSATTPPGPRSPSWSRSPVTSRSSGPTSTRPRKACTSSSLLDEAGKPLPGMLR
jgi:hypothetical protein